MNYNGVLISVKNMQKSKEFYKNFFGLEVIDDFGGNVLLTGGISLQEEGLWKSFIQTDKILNGNDFELFFEEDNFDEFVDKLEKNDSVIYVHSVIEHSWGQMVVRLYDPDGHIIEVGENMKMVVKRFLDSGLTVEATATRMDVSVQYIKANM